MKENLVYDKRVTLEVYKGEEAAAGDAAVEDGMILKLKNGDTVKEYTIHTVLRLSTLVYEIEGQQSVKFQKEQLLVLLKKI